MEKEFDIQSTNAYNCGKTSATLAQFSQHLLTGPMIYMGDSGDGSYITADLEDFSWKANLERLIHLKSSTPNNKHQIILFHLGDIGGGKVLVDFEWRSIIIKLPF